jgi:hypothetical protein
VERCTSGTAIAAQASAAWLAPSRLTAKQACGVHHHVGARARDGVGEGMPIRHVGAGAIKRDDSGAAAAHDRAAELAGTA